MGFDPDKYLASSGVTQQSQSNSFDPDKYLSKTPIQEEQKDPIQEFKEGITPVETFATKLLGPLADEGLGAAGAVADYLTGKYKDWDTAYRVNRNTARGAFKLAEEQNPKSAILGDVGHGVATSFVPGLGVTKLAKGASLGQKALQGLQAGSRAGAYYGFGASEADNLKDMALDTAKGTVTGAGVGAVTPVVLDTAGKAIKNAPSFASKLIFGTPFDASKRYIARPNQVNSAPTIMEYAKTLPNKLSNISDDIAEGSDEFMGSLSPSRNNNGVPVTNVVRALRKDRFSEGATEKLNSKARALIEKARDRQALGADVTNPNNMSEVEVKNFIRGLGKEGKFLKSNMSPDEAAINKAYSNVSGLLKENNPTYAAGVKDVAEKINLKKDLIKKFGLERKVGGGWQESDRTGSALRQIGKMNRVDKGRVTDEMQRLGYAAKDELEDVIAKQRIETPWTLGSRNVNVGQGLGFAMDKATGMPGVFTAMGTAAGAGADVAGGFLNKNFILKPAAFINKLANTPNAQKFAIPLQKALDRGSASYGATYYMLSRDPEFQKIIGSGSDE